MKDDDVHLQITMLFKALFFSLSFNIQLQRNKLMTVTCPALQEKLNQKHTKKEKESLS